jgi:hypothetical protein
LQFADRLQLAVTLTVAPRTQTQLPSRTARIPLRKTSPRRPSAKPAASPQTARSAALA